MLTKLLLVKLLFLCLTNGEQTSGKNILVFGGNGFMGAAAVQKLFADGHSVTIVNRGNWYWDGRQTVFPHVKFIPCDRYRDALRESCPDLVKFVMSSEKLDFIIDFSAFDSTTVKEVFEILGEKAGIYIFISTDSVYEVVAKNHSKPSREEDATRPLDQILQDTLAQGDNYGNEKLATEELIVKARKDNTGPSYVLLRLPDVIGPRDNTDRWWQYQIWLTVSAILDRPVTLPTRLRGQALSYVYVDDVANVIKQIVDNPDPNILDSAYNIGYEEKFFLSDVLRAIKNELGLKNFEIEWVSSEKNPYFLYPSVTNGPIDVTKAVKTLNLKVTPWKDTVRLTTQFFDDALKNNANQFHWHIEKVLHKLKFNLFRGIEDKFDLAIADIYGYTKGYNKTPKEEL